ncbi:hypothetical protein LWI29_019685 [Acer saccharum]|uniref:Uncharacterized protein n=1 Tax=Acer saccharum TaxID=4024 RepID=A0AA39VTF4_ACESA|nr:hypothetical protein LWI29_019685 [Acer saccharum]
MQHCPRKTKTGLLASPLQRKPMVSLSTMKTSTRNSPSPTQTKFSPKISSEKRKASLVSNSQFSPQSQSNLIGKTIFRATLAGPRLSFLRSRTFISDDHGGALAHMEARLHLRFVVVAVENQQRTWQDIVRLNAVSKEEKALIGALVFPAVKVSQ